MARATFLAVLALLAVATPAAHACFTGYSTNCKNATTNKNVVINEKCFIDSNGFGVKHYPSDIKSCAGVTVKCFLTAFSNGACGSVEPAGYACGICDIVNGKVAVYCVAGSKNDASTWYFGQTNTAYNTWKDNTPSCKNPMTYDANGICGDPHFAAPGGIFFDWHGVRDETFSIISDSHLQVNGHLVGQRLDSDLVEHGTWFQELSLGYVNEKNGETHFVSVGTDQDKEYESADTFYFTYDGEDIPAGSGSGVYTWQSPDEMVTITREPHMRTEVRVQIEGIVDALIHTRLESRIQLEPLGKYLDLELKDVNLTRHVHGVLGQMFRPDIQQRKAAAGADVSSHEFLVEGSTGDYRVSSLTSYDSMFNQFNDRAGVAVSSVKFVDAPHVNVRKLMRSVDAAEEEKASFSLACTHESGKLVCA